MTRSKSWIAVLKESAVARGGIFPRFCFDVGGMGAATSERVGDRCVTLKHRLDARVTPVPHWVQWSLWQGDPDRPELVASFTTARKPDPAESVKTFDLLWGFLHQGWSVEEAREQVRQAADLADNFPPGQPLTTT